MDTKKFLSSPKMLSEETYNRYSTWQSLHAYHFGTAEGYESMRERFHKDERYYDDEYKVYVEWFIYTFTPLGQALI